MVREVSGEEKGGGTSSCCVQACKRVEEFPSVGKLSRRASNMTASFLKEPFPDVKLSEASADHRRTQVQWTLLNIKHPALRVRSGSNTIFSYQGTYRARAAATATATRCGRQAEIWRGRHFLRLHARWWGGFYCLGGLLCTTVLAGYIYRQQP